MSSPPELEIGQWYKTQDEALKAMEERGDSILVKWGRFQFTSFVDQECFLDFINETPPEQRCFFEVLLEGKPQWMFADLDGEGLTITQEELYKQWSKLMEQIFESVGLKLNSRNVRLLNSTGDKISGHWSYLGDLVFENSEKQKEFWQYVESVIESSYPDLCFLRTRQDGKMELKTVLDLGVYSKNRPMRTIYSHKVGSDRVLKPCRLRGGKVNYIQQTDPMDYLIYCDDKTEFYQLQGKIPEYQKVRNRFFTREQIEKLILKHVSNVEVGELEGRLFKLNTVGTRTCLINGEENESDNCYVVWRRDGLYFGCHDSGCEGEMRKICEFNLSPEVPPTIKTIDDLRRLGSSCKTWQKQKELIDIIVAWMNKKYCLVKANKTFVLEEFQDLDENDEYTCGIKYKDMKSMFQDFSNKSVITKLSDEECKDHEPRRPPEQVNHLNPFDLWMKHRNRREVDKLIFNPKMFYEKDPKTKDFYNLFDGFKISKESVESEELPEDFEQHAFFTHIRQRWCLGNKKVYNIILNVFAHILQKPWEKLNISVVLRSTERTGKGIPLQIFKEIIGSKYFFQPSKPSQVLGDFNGQMKSVLVCFLDEMVWGGDKEKAGTLKKLVTEKINYINEKFAPVVRVKNLADVFMASNEDWVVPAGATEQRWLVLNVSDELAICGKKKKNAIVKDILSVDRRKLAKFLYSRDLTGWSHRETVNTQGLRDQKIQSLGMIRRWWLNCITNDDGLNLFDGKKLMTEIYDRFEIDAKPGKHMNETKFWIDMKHIIGKKYNRKRQTINGVRGYYINMPNLAECRDRWRELYNDPEWPFNSGYDCDSDSDSDCE